VRREANGLGIALGQDQTVVFEHAALRRVVLWVVRRAADGGDADDLPPEWAQACSQLLPGRRQGNPRCLVGAPTEDDITQHHGDAGVLGKAQEVLPARFWVDHRVRTAAGECLGAEIEHGVAVDMPRLVRAVEVGVDGVQDAPQEPVRFCRQGATAVEAMYQALGGLEGLPGGFGSGSERGR
jgi:hypothetical protein